MVACMVVVEIPNYNVGLLKKKKEIIANETKEEAPLRTFKKTYLVAFFGHTHATETTLK